MAKKKSTTAQEAEAVQEAAVSQEAENAPEPAEAEGSKATFERRWDEDAELYAVTFRAGLNLREGPGRSYPVITVLPCGAVLEAAEPLDLKGGRYAEIASPWGNGWVDTGYLVRLLEV